MNILAKAVLTKCVWYIASKKQAPYEVQLFHGNYAYIHEPYFFLLIIDIFYLSAMILSTDFSVKGVKKIADFIFQLHGKLSHDKAFHLSLNLDSFIVSYILLLFLLFPPSKLRLSNLQSYDSFMQQSV